MFFVEKKVSADQNLKKLSMDAEISDSNEGYISKCILVKRYRNTVVFVQDQAPNIGPESRSQAGLLKYS